ncbi:hypothetical protein BH09PSE4_BH09PSE4_23400 [soil metagenome]
MAVSFGQTVKAFGAALVLAGLTGILGWTFAVTWRPAPGDFPIQGVDVTESNGDIDFPSLKAAGADFAYIRATYGADGRDARFADYWHDAYEADVRRGALHAYSFCRLAADQANNFITTVPRTSDALPAAVVIDFADDCPDRPVRAVVLSEIERFLTMVETHTGKPMLIKVSDQVEHQYRLSSAIKRSLWSTRFFFPPDYSTRPWRMWQASGIRHVDGVATPVNWDVVAR